MNRHLLSIDDLSRDDIERILGRAESFAEVSGREIKKVPTLRGRTVINLFYEASTRTSSSFELAAKRLSADLVSIKSSGSAVDKGESLKDTVQTLSAYDPAAIVIRSPQVGAAALVARWTRASVVNAGDGKHEHPTQALLDLYTLKQRLGALEGLKVWIVGDVLHSRVARSNILALGRMGCEVTLCGPPTLIPRGIESLGCRVETTLDRLEDADVVYALRMQLERMSGSFVPSLREYAAQYQIDGRRLSPNQVLMHPGPVNRGVELAAEVIDSPQALIVAAGGVGRGGAHGRALRAARRARGPSRAAGGAHDRAAAGMNAAERNRSRPLELDFAPTRARRGAAARRAAARPAHGPGRREGRAGARRPRGRAGQRHRGARRRRAGGRRRPARVPGLRRPARAPAHARPRGRGGHRLRHAGRGRGRLLRHPRSAQHAPGRGLGARAALAARARPRRGPHPHRLPGRDHRGPAGREAHRDGRPGRRRRAGLHRRRAAGALGRGDAPGAPVPAPGRPPAGPARGGSHAVGRGRDARGRGVGAAGPGRHPVGVRVRAGGARLRAGRLRGGAHPRAARVRARDRGGARAGQGGGHPGDLRGLAAPPAAHRRGACARSTPTSR